MACSMAAVDVEMPDSNNWSLPIFSVLTNNATAASKVAEIPWWGIHRSCQSRH